MSLSLWNASQVLELLVRVTVLLGAAGALSWALRRRAASLRHLLWTSTFIVLLFLPLAVGLLPSWEIEMPQRDRRVPTAWVFASLRMAETGGGASVAWPNGVPPVMAAEMSEEKATEPPAAGFKLAPYVLGGVALWGLGAFIALLSLARGWLRFHSWVQQGKALEEPGWEHALNQLRTGLRIWRQVRLVETPEVSTPQVGGILRPVILLPRSSQHWTPARRRAVLAHELVHVQRHDVLRQVVGSAALALYWFHPLGWLAARWALASREHACDEGVLSLGSSRPSEYARHLLALADGHERPSPALSLPMVHKSQLEQRIRAILKPSRPAPSKVLLALLCVLMLGAATAAAVAKPVAPPPLKMCVPVIY